MHIFESLRQLTASDMLKGTPPSNSYDSPVYIRWYQRELYVCEEEGYPTEKFQIETDFVESYTWELSQLPPLTHATFNKAKEWLESGKSILLCSTEGKEIEFENRQQDIHCSDKDFTLAWDDILHGEWFLKNE